MTPLSTLITLLYLTSSQFAVARPLRGADLAAILARSSRSDVPITFRRASLDLTEAQVAALAPPLGWTAGVNPSGTGTCDGAVPDENGNPIQVPCDCPPSQEVYIADLTANVNAGFALNNTVLPVSYPLDDSIQSQLTRLTAASVTIQNLAGIGAGCPVTSTTFAAQQAALLAELPTAAPPPPSPPSVPATSSSAFASSSLPAPSSSNTVVATTPAPVSTQPSSASASTLASSTIPSSPSVAPTSSASTMASASGTSSASPLPTGVPSNKTIIELSPQIGWTAGINPKGNGNCDGAQLDDTGAPIQVPCACPPEQAAFDQALVINVITGHAVNNTEDAMPFPTDSSSRSLATRIFAAIATLQNLEGPGVGCPVASTTFLAQLNTALAAF